MTGAQTEQVQVASFETATAIVLRIANSLFHLAIRGSGDGTAWQAWSACRGLASRFLATRSISLTASECEVMADALTVAHEISHGLDRGAPCVAIEHCECSMAKDQRELAQVFADAEASNARTN